MTKRNQGFFIAFCGHEGVGKSTQVELLKQRFEEEGYSVVKTREPGGSPGAEELRNLLVNGPVDRWDKISELFLFTAARRNHVETLIKPALLEGKIVICDRFVPCTFAYQGYGHGVDLKLIEEVTKMAIGNFVPDITIFLSTSIEVGLERAHRRRGTEMRFESMDTEFHKRVHDGYRQISYRKDIIGNTHITIDTTSEENETADESIIRIHKFIENYIVYELAIQNPYLKNK